MKKLIRRDLARWLYHRVRLAGVAVVVLSLVSTGVAGCGGSPSEISGIASPTVEAGMVEPTMPVTPTLVAPTPAPAVPAPTPTLVAPTPIPATPTATPTPVAPTPTVPPPTSIAVPPASGFVLEHPNIPREIEERILEYRYSPLDIPRANEASEIQTYVKKIKCEEAASIAYVQYLMTQVHSNEVGDQNDATVESIGQHSWRVPWKNGHLHFGYPKPIDPCIVEAKNASDEATVWWFPSLHGEPYLLARTSDDGSNWTEPVRLFVPFVLPSLRAYGEEALSPQILVASDGNHLLVAIEEKSNVKVFISTDLNEWHQLTIPFYRPDYLHPQLSVSFDIEDAVLGPNGWLISVTITMRLGIWRLLPDDVKENIAGSSTLWPSSENGEEGFLIDWSSADGLSKQRFFSSEELGISHEIFSIYGSEYGNKPYLQSSNFSRWVWPEVWNEKSSVDYPDNWTELPYIGAKGVVIL